MAITDELLMTTAAIGNTTLGAAITLDGTVMTPSQVDDAFRELMAYRARAITRHVAKAAGTYGAVKADHNQFWRCTGAVTINLAAAATLTDGWCLWVRANGDAVTIDPSGAETIDGAATLVLADGQMALVVCTGTAFFTVLSTLGVSTFIGCVVDFAGTAAPAGWLLCFGQSLLRSDYTALFAVISTTYGAADGTHFNLPDLRGRVLAGKDDMGGTSANRLTSPINGDILGAAGGTESHALTDAQMPSHTHTGPSHTHGPGTLAGTTNSTGTHSHGITGQLLLVSGGATGFAGGANGLDTTPTTANAGAHSHTVDVSSGVTAAGGTGATGLAGSDASHNNVQPTIIMNKIIYAGV